MTFGAEDQQSDSAVAAAESAQCSRDKGEGHNTRLAELQSMEIEDTSVLLNLTVVQGKEILCINCWLIKVLCMLRLLVDCMIYSCLYQNFTSYFKSSTSVHPMERIVATFVKAIKCFRTLC